MSGSFDMKVRIYTFVVIVQRYLHGDPAGTCELCVAMPWADGVYSRARDFSEFGAPAGRYLLFDEALTLGLVYFARWLE